MKQNKKIWFNIECNNVKLEVRKLGRHKGKDPKNNLLYNIYYINTGERAGKRNRNFGKKK